MIRNLKYYFLKYRLDLVIPFLWALVLGGIFTVVISGVFFKDQKKTSTQVLASNYESIGQGLFSLNPQYLNPHTPKVLDSFFVIQGAKKVHGSDYLYLGSYDTDHLQKLSHDQFLKLDILKDDQGHGVVWLIKPILEDKEAVVFEAQEGAAQPVMISLPIINTHELYKDKYQAFLKNEAIGILAQAKIGGIDALFEQEKAKKIVIVLNAKHILSLAVDEALYCVDGKWQKEAAQNCLMAELKAEGFEYYFNIIDPSGFLQHSLPVSKIKEEPFNFSLMMPETVKVYESGVISCLIGHQKLILKQGDWILKSQHMCHVLKSRASLEKLLNFQRYGPLCVIEEVQLRKERSLVRGKIFSPLRIKAHPFEIEAPIVKISKNLPKTRSKGVKKESL